MVWILSVLLLVCAVFSAGNGAVRISVPELWEIVAFKLGLVASTNVEEQKSIVFWVIRLPRVCLGVIIGAGLGIAGASLQGLFRNSIADSTLIGVTSGASLFAVFVIMLNVKYLGILNEIAGVYGISFVGFLGAAVTTFLVYQLSKVTGDGGSVTTLLLCDDHGFCFKSNCIQIHTGPVNKIFVMGPWLNIMDPEFNLHLREDAIDEAWVVRKPTEDGIVTGIELIDKDGVMFNQFFGKRKPGIPELSEWPQLIEQTVIKTD